MHAIEHMSPRPVPSHKYPSPDCVRHHTPAGAPFAAVHAVCWNSSIARSGSSASATFAIKEQIAPTAMPMLSRPLNVSPAAQRNVAPYAHVRRIFQPYASCVPSSRDRRPQKTNDARDTDRRRQKLCRPAPDNAIGNPPILKLNCASGVSSVYRGACRQFLDWSSL